MHCYFNSKKYFIDSEILGGPEHGIVVYSSSIYLLVKSEKGELDGFEKKNVLEFLFRELEKMKIKYEVM